MFNLNDYVKISNEHSVFYKNNEYNYVVEYTVNNQQIKNDIAQLKDDLKNLQKLFKKDLNIHVDEDSIVITLIDEKSYSLD